MMNPDGKSIQKVNSEKETLVLGVVDELTHAKDEYRVILQGRAKCRVIGPVKAGALLVPSSKAGFAEAAGLYIRPGTIIGKALLAHLPAKPEDEGEIDILVTLS